MLIESRVVFYQLEPFSRTLSFVISNSFGVIMNYGLPCAGQRAREKSQIDKRMTRKNSTI